MVQTVQTRAKKKQIYGSVEEAYLEFMLTVQDISMDMFYMIV